MVFNKKSVTWGEFLQDNAYEKQHSTERYHRVTLLRDISFLEHTTGFVILCKLTLWSSWFSWHLIPCGHKNATLFLYQDILTLNRTYYLGLESRLLALSTCQPDASLLTDCIAEMTKWNIKKHKHNFDFNAFWKKLISANWTELSKSTELLY